jgi:hypothetical protein
MSLTATLRWQLEQGTTDWEIRMHGTCSRRGEGDLCYIFSMKRRRSRRAGATETFSVSVDAETKRALRKLADSDYDGNLSALVTDLAVEARRRMAAGRYLKRLRIPPLTPPEADVLEATIGAEIAAARKRRRPRKVA